MIEVTFFVCGNLGSLGLREIGDVDKGDGSGAFTGRDEKSSRDEYFIWVFHEFGLIRPLGYSIDGLIFDIERIFKVLGVFDHVHTICAKGIKGCNDQGGVLSAVVVDHSGVGEVKWFLESGEGSGG